MSSDSLMPISKKIERTLGVTVVVRDDQLKIIGTPSAASGAQEVFEQLYELAKRGNVISEQNVNYALALFCRNTKGLRW